MSRRILLTSWNPSDVPKGCLPPCHITFQIYVHGEDNKEISGLLNMRSNDLGLGHPYNIVSYSLLLHMIAHVTNKKATKLCISEKEASEYVVKYREMYHNKYNYFIEHRKGSKFVRCEKWCNVNCFCPLYQEHINKGEK